MTPVSVLRHVAIAYAALVLCLVGIWYLSYLAQSHGMMDPSGQHLIGGDFINYYSASDLWQSGQINTLFDVHEYQAYLSELYGQAMPRNWSYPPSFILFLLPLSALPYVSAYVVWAVGGLVVFIGTTLKSTANQMSSHWHSYALMVALAPASLINAFFGQNGFITGVLLYAGVRLASTRPIVSGICIGLLTIKPQLGLLIPIMLILTRNWTAILSATLTAIILCSVSVLVFGWQSWIDYFELVLPFQRYVMEEWGGLFLKMMPSAYALGRPFTGITDDSNHTVPASAQNLS